jgi:hypothetical protein
MYSETLPVEVTPLGVNVVTIMTSIVASKMFDNTLHANLPEISYYHPSAPNIAKLACGKKFASVNMPPRHTRRVLLVTCFAGIVG